MGSTVRGAAAVVETAQEDFPKRSDARASSLSDRSDAERLNERTTDTPSPTAEQRARSPFLRALSGRDEARCAHAALADVGTYASWVGP